ncbi:MAG: hypothetical protein NTX72_04730 [Candidatus Uhrbacteria bacterium]|nr:hypothetical protein [Candidatus Uhrbacteria bacterium]
MTEVRLSGNFVDGTYVEYESGQAFQKENPLRAKIRQIEEQGRFFKIYVEGSSLCYSDTLFHRAVIWEYEGVFYIRSGSESFCIAIAPEGVSIPRVEQRSFQVAI